MIDLEHVSKEYKRGGPLALDDINLHVDDGEFVFLLGDVYKRQGMAWGFNPFLMSADQYKGAQMAVIESVTKLVASGFRYEDAYLTFQEYFERLGTKPERWGKPLACLLYTSRCV